MSDVVWMTHRKFPGKRTHDPGSCGCVLATGLLFSHARRHAISTDSLQGLFACGASVNCDCDQSPSCTAEWQRFEPAERQAGVAVHDTGVSTLPAQREDAVRRWRSPALGVAATGRWSVRGGELRLQRVCFGEAFHSGSAGGLRGGGGATDGPTDGPEGVRKPRNTGNRKTMNPENACVFPGSVVEFAGIRRGEMLRQGFEP